MYTGELAASHIFVRDNVVYGEHSEVHFAGTVSSAEVSGNKVCFVHVPDHVHERDNEVTEQCKPLDEHELEIIGEPSLDLILAQAAAEATVAAAEALGADEAVTRALGAEAAKPVAKLANVAKSAAEAAVHEKVDGMKLANDEPAKRAHAEDGTKIAVVAKTAAEQAKAGAKAAHAQTEESLGLDVWVAAAAADEAQVEAEAIRETLEKVTKPADRDFVEAHLQTAERASETAKMASAKAAADEAQSAYLSTEEEKAGVEADARTAAGEAKVAVMESQRAASEVLDRVGPTKGAAILDVAKASTYVVNELMKL